MLRDVASCSIFQSTCPRGARLFRVFFAKRLPNFNPRAHEGHDPYFNIIKVFMQFQSTCPRGARLRTASGSAAAGISIHVPTRGTTDAGASGSAARDFNPRAHEGHDMQSMVSGSSRGFQSTCPRGARRSFFVSLLARKNFNPRAHEGHD